MSKYIIFLLIEIVISLYVTGRLAAHAPWVGGGKWVWLAGFVLFVLQACAFSTLDLDYKKHGVPVLSFAAFAAMGFFLTMLPYVFIADIVKIAAGFLPAAPAPETVARVYFWGVSGIGLASVALGMWMAIFQRVEVTRVDVPVANLPAAFDGYRIVQVSDLHIGPILRRGFAEKITAMVNAENADMIAATGDFTDGSVRLLEDELAPLRSLSARDGVFYVPGNHETYRDYREWMRWFDGIGWKVLLNRHEIVTREGREMAVAGVLDYGSVKAELPAPYASDPFAAARGMADDIPAIMLAHQPADYARVARAGFDLMLSGHTHGGQFLPWNFFIGFAHTYARGLGKFEDMHIYVTRGAGFWGPALRSPLPGEIVVLTLRRAEKA